MAITSLAIWVYSFVTMNIGLILANGGYLIAAVLYTTGALVWRDTTRVSGHSRLGLRAVIAICGGVILLLAVCTYLAFRGLVPPFYIPGTGFTQVRTVVQALGATLLLLTGLLLIWRYLQSKNRFLYWYSQGVLLLGIGLTTRLFLISSNDIISWLGRLDTYVGGIFIILAVVSATKEAHTRRVRWPRLSPHFLGRPRRIARGQGG